jgi:putative hydrolase of the HAD superfamily
MSRDMRKAVLFDLDDTLSDRRASIARYARRFHADFLDDREGVDVAGTEALIHDVDRGGYAPRDQVFSALLRGLPWRGPPDVSRLADHWAATFPAETAGREGLLSTLEELRRRGFVLGVVTNGGERIQQSKIDALGIRALMGSVVISGVVGFDKPDVRIFERGLGELGCAGRDAWFVGDHPRNDILGAAAAGLQPVWLRGVHEWPAGTPLPSHQIDGLGELLEIVDRGGDGGA